MVPAQLGRIERRTIGDLAQQDGEIAHDPRHDRFAFGIAEADIIFDQLGAFGRQHQPGVEHAVERHSFRSHCPRRRFDNLPHRTRFKLGGQHGRRRIGTHAAGVRPDIAFADPLVVLRTRQNDRAFAVDEREQARFLTLKEFLDHQRPIARGADCVLRFDARRRDGDAFTGRKTVRLNDHRNRKVIERFQRLAHSIGPDISGGRNAVSRTQILGEALASFKLGGGRRRPEHRDTSGAARIGNPRDQRRLGADHHQVDRFRLRKRNHGIGIGRVDRKAARPACNARIARRSDQSCAAWRLP